MKRTRMLAIIFAVSVAALLAVFTFYRLVGCMAIAWSSPLTLGLAVAMFWSYRRERMDNVSSETADGLSLWAWRALLVSVTVTMALVLWITYVMVFDFRYMTM